MYARLISVALLVASLFCTAASYSTPNFVVSAPDPAFAKKIGDLAERYRRELAVKWLGRELPTWSERCPITVEIAMHAGGETSFAFVPGPGGQPMPVGWQMKIFGSPERLVDSVLPHEITHTVFATHFGCPLPRWADEGACTTVEHNSEKSKNHDMLLEFLTTERGIPFNRMFSMKQYPRDILPLYAQGYSLARFLIMQRGHQHFVNYVGAGMDRETRGAVPLSWNQVTQEYYGYDDLSDLQVQWLDWVRKGCPELSLASSADPISIASSNRPVPRSEVATAEPSPSGDEPVVAQLDARPTTQADNSGSWYLDQMRRAGETNLRKPAPDVAGQRTIWR